MTKQSLINADDALKSYSKFSSLSEGIYQALIAKPHEIARLVRIAIDPEAEGITHTHYPLLVCQLLHNYPYLLLVLFSVERNADCLFKFLQGNPNATQLGYFSKIVSLFNSNTQQQTLKYLKQNQKILSLCFSKIHIPAVFRFLFDCTVLCKIENQVRSIILMKLYKQIIIQPSEEVAQSIKQTLGELIQNYQQYGITLKQTICNIFDQEYIRQIVNIVLANEDHYISEYCLGVLSNVVTIYQKIKNQQVFELKKLSIQSGISQLLNQLKSLSNLLSEEPHEFLINALNEKVYKITMLKLKLSHFFKVVVQNTDFKLFENNSFRPLDLLQIIIKQISINPWANLVHNQLMNTAIIIIQKNTAWGEDIVEILSYLMQLFKNRFYIYLSSGKTITLGNAYHLYQIIKKLSIVLDKLQQLEGIFKNYKPWKKFLVQDLQKYEQLIKNDCQTYCRSLEECEPSISSLIVKMNQKNQASQINKFLQDLNDSYVQVVKYTVWDKRRQSYK